MPFSISASNCFFVREPWHSRGLRFFPVDNYLVFYKTNDETETVYIVRIMYRGRDVRKQLSRTEDVSENCPPERTEVLCCAMVLPHKAGRVYSADEVEAEMKREFGI